MFASSNHPFLLKVQCLTTGWIKPVKDYIFTYARTVVFTPLALCGMLSMVVSHCCMRMGSVEFIVQQKAGENVMNQYLCHKIILCKKIHCQINVTRSVLIDWGEMSRAVHYVWYRAGVLVPCFKLNSHIRDNDKHKRMNVYKLFKIPAASYY